MADDAWTVLFGWFSSVGICEGKFSGAPLVLQHYCRSNNNNTTAVPSAFAISLVMVAVAAVSLCTQMLSAHKGFVQMRFANHPDRQWVATDNRLRRKTVQTS